MQNVRDEAAGECAPPVESNVKSKRKREPRPIKPLTDSQRDLCGTVVSAVSAEVKVPVESIMSRESTRSVCAARFVCIHIIKSRFGVSEGRPGGISNEQIGVYFGLSGHVPVCHALKTVRGLLDVDRSHRELVSRCDSAVSAAMSPAPALQVAAA